MKTLTLKNIVLASTLAVICGSASAAQTAVSDIKTATADITFSSTSTITHTLTPVKDLVAGKVADKTTVANGSVTGADANNYVALRFTANTAEDIDPMLGNFATLVGKNKDNKLQLALTPAVGSDYKAVQVDNVAWMALEKGQNAYKLVVNKEQTIAADTYTASIDALEVTQ